MSVTHLTSHRQKRGIFNGASSGLKWLIGTPDSDDAESYSKSNDALMHNDRDTQLIMKQQIHVMSDTIDNFNKSSQSLKLNEERLNNNIIAFNKFVQNATDSINLLYYKIAVV